MKKMFLALVALVVLLGACKSYDRQSGNADRLDLFHQQKQVR